jgi:hypothetical protein
MPDTIIRQVNQLGKGQPELLLFADYKGRLIGDQVELTGVDGMEKPGPQEVVYAVESDDLDSVNEIVAEHSDRRLAVQIWLMWRMQLPNQWCTQRKLRSWWNQ